VRAWWMGAVCLAWLRFGTLGGAQRMLARLAGAGGLSADEAAWTAEAGAGRVPGGRCLTKALVGEALLRASGYDPELCIGVAVKNGFRAHAWVELHGRVVVGAGGAGEYERLAPARAVMA
jgi:hypothetical protein